MNKKSTGLLLSILGVISLVLITAGVTYAFFSYAKQGTTENVIKTGTITFLYDELEGVGNGIKITDAIPMTDEVGKALADANQYFDFKVTSTVSGDGTIPYEVTLRQGKMYDFANKLFNVALPRVRDFRGIPADSFDGRGNYSMGIKEQLIFPEIEYEKVDRVRGMDIIFVTTAKTDEEAKELLKLLGMPFKN